MVMSHRLTTQTERNYSYEPYVHRVWIMIESEMNVFVCVCERENELSTSRIF